MPEPKRSSDADNPSSSGPFIQGLEESDALEMVRVFCEALPSRMSAFEAAWRAGEFRQLTRMAHQLKGCSAMYGFENIGEAAAALEQQLRQLERDSQEDQLRLIRMEMDELLTRCSSACQSNPP